MPDNANLTQVQDRIAIYAFPAPMHAIHLRIPYSNAATWPACANAVSYPHSHEMQGMHCNAS